MESDIPKVLHRIGGRTMISILLDTLLSLGFERLVVVIGFKGEAVQRELADLPVSFAWQREQLGTGHAVTMTKELLADFDGTTLVALGDVPFLSARSIRRLFDTHERTGAAATCLSALLDDPVGYGRIVREGEGDMLREIVEHKDASEDIRAIREINTGTFCFDNKRLFEALAMIGNENVQGEYYLTDTVKVMHDKDLPVAVVAAEDADEVRGVNSEEQLRLLETKFAHRL